jgi:type I restriction enzyme M protein
MPRGKKNGTNGKQPNGNGANLGFEQTLWAAADKMRGHMDAAEYKHVALGLIFLKYISDAFQELYDDLAARADTDYTDPEDRSTWLRMSSGCRRKPAGATLIHNTWFTTWPPMAWPGLCWPMGR